MGRWLDIRSRDLHADVDVDAGGGARDGGSAGDA
jgi:hypothetical protein